MSTQFIFWVVICSKIDVHVLQFSDGLWILILIFFCIELQATSLSYNKAVIENSDVSETLVKVSGVFWFLFSWMLVENYQTIENTKRQAFFMYIYIYMYFVGPLTMSFWFVFSVPGIAGERCGHQTGSAQCLTAFFKRIR